MNSPLCKSTKEISSRCTISNVSQDKHVITEGIPRILPRSNEAGLDFFECKPSGKAITNTVCAQGLSHEELSISGQKIKGRDKLDNKNVSEGELKNQVMEESIDLHHLNNFTPIPPSPTMSSTPLEMSTASHTLTEESGQLPKVRIATELLREIEEVGGSTRLTRELVMELAMRSLLGRSRAECKEDSKGGESTEESGEDKEVYDVSNF